jgi:hypothetical protein
VILSVEQFKRFSNKKDIVSIGHDLVGLLKIYFGLMNSLPE